MNTASLVRARVTVRRAGARGRTELEWLDSRHTFSFGDYTDPRHMGFHALRVINEDRVAPRGGFPTHTHRDMEIFSYVLEGALEHRDSMGNRGIVKPGQTQVMSAGRGVTHSEYNAGAGLLHFLQVWIEPDVAGLEPGYQEWDPEAGSGGEEKALVISPDGRDGSARIHQDAEVYRLHLQRGRSFSHELRDGRGLWLQMIAGRAELNGVELAAGDGASIDEGGSHRIAVIDSGEALLFDLG